VCADYRALHGDTRIPQSTLLNSKGEDTTEARFANSLPEALPTDAGQRTH
jgi:hypothetical protein